MIAEVDGHTVDYIIHDYQPRVYARVDGSGPMPQDECGEEVEILAVCKGGVEVELPETQREYMQEKIICDLLTWGEMI